MPKQRLTDKLSFKLLWTAVGILGGLCIFFIRDWYVNTNISKAACADEIKKVNERVIVIETIIPEIRNFMEKLDKRMYEFEKKKLKK